MRSLLHNERECWAIAHRVQGTRPHNDQDRPRAARGKVRHQSIIENSQMGGALNKGNAGFLNQQFMPHQETFSKNVY